ncbi:hypothetical protein ACTFIT_007562 [Dictyostelium discoideum]
MLLFNSPKFTNFNYWELFAFLPILFTTNYTVHSLTPSIGKVGDTITINGQNLDTDIYDVYFNIIDDNSKIKATITSRTVSFVKVIVPNGFGYALVYTQNILNPTTSDKLSFSYPSPAIVKVISQPFSTDIINRFFVIGQNHRSLITNIVINPYIDNIEKEAIYCEIVVGKQASKTIYPSDLDENPTNYNLYYYPPAVVDISEVSTDGGEVIIKGTNFIPASLKDQINNQPIIGSPHSVEFNNVLSSSWTWIDSTHVEAIVQKGIGTISTIVNVGGQRSDLNPIPVNFYKRPELDNKKYENFANSDILITGSNFVPVGFSAGSSSSVKIGGIPCNSVTWVDSKSVIWQCDFLCSDLSNLELAKVIRENKKDLKSTLLLTGVCLEQIEQYNFTDINDEIESSWIENSIINDWTSGKFYNYFKSSESYSTVKTLAKYITPKNPCIYDNKRVKNSLDYHFEINSDIFHLIELSISSKISYPDSPYETYFYESSSNPEYGLSIITFDSAICSFTESTIQDYQSGKELQSCSIIPIINQVINPTTTLQAPYQYSLTIIGRLFDSSTRIFLSGYECPIIGNIATNQNDYIQTLSCSVPPEIESYSPSQIKYEDGSDEIVVKFNNEPTAIIENTETYIKIKTLSGDEFNVPIAVELNGQISNTDTSFVYSNPIIESVTPSSSSSKSNTNIIIKGQNLGYLTNTPKITIGSSTKQLTLTYESYQPTYSQFTHKNDDDSDSHDDDDDDHKNNNGPKNTILSILGGIIGAAASAAVSGFITSIFGGATSVATAAATATAIAGAITEGVAVAFTGVSVIAATAGGIVITSIVTATAILISGGSTQSPNPTPTDNYWVRCMVDYSRLTLQVDNLYGQDIVWIDGNGISSIFKESFSCKPDLINDGMICTQQHQNGTNSTTTFGNSTLICHIDPTKSCEISPPFIIPSDPIEDDEYSNILECQYNLIENSLSTHSNNSPLRCYNNETENYFTMNTTLSCSKDESLSQDKYTISCLSDTDDTQIFFYKNSITCITDYPYYKCTIKIS